MQNIRIMLRLALLFVIPLAGSGSAAAGGTVNEQERIVDFRGDLTILSDGSLSVHEMVRLHNNGALFSHGLERIFTAIRHDQHGRTWKVDYADFVILRDGNRENYTTGTEGEELIVQPQPSGGVLPVGDHIYEISYVTHHQIQRYGDVDELRRKPLGLRGIPVESFRIIVKPPAAVPSSRLDVTAFTGATASNLYCACRQESGPTGELIFTSTGLLVSPEDFTLEIRFPAGYLRRPRSEEARLWLENNGAFSAMGLFLLSLLLNCLVLIAVFHIIGKALPTLSQRTFISLLASAAVAGLSLGSMAILNQPFTGLPGSGLGILISMLLAGTVHGPSDRYSWLVFAFGINCFFYYVIIKLIRRLRPALLGGQIQTGAPR